MKEQKEPVVAAMEKTMHLMTTAELETIRITNQPPAAVFSELEAAQGTPIAEKQKEYQTSI